MRAAILLLVVGAAFAQAPTFQPVGTMSQLMVDVIYPASDAIFYAFREPPKNEHEWNILQGQALVVAETGNLLMLPSRARDQDKWMADAKLLVDVGAAAYKAAKAKNMDAIVALNEQLNTACVTCHQDYRPNYRRRQPAPKQ
jgi:cytochrome c553